MIMAAFHAPVVSLLFRADVIFAPFSLAIPLGIFKGRLMTVNLSGHFGAAAGLKIERYSAASEGTQNCSSSSCLGFQRKICFIPTNGFVYIFGSFTVTVNSRVSWSMR